MSRGIPRRRAKVVRINFQGDDKQSGRAKGTWCYINFQGDDKQSGRADRTWCYLN